MMPSAQIRSTMVESQLRPNKVTDGRVLAAFDAVPRELFVAAGHAGNAYIDEDLPLGGGRFLMEPVAFARQLQAADIGPADRILEIGGGTGYGAALLSRLAAEVIAVESDPRLAGEARSILARMGASNVSIEEAPLAGGFPGRAPYDVIVFAGAIGDVPSAILDQLGETGRLVCVLSSAAGGLGAATLIERSGAGIVRRVLFEAGVPVLPGLEPKSGFVF